MPVATLDRHAADGGDATASLPRRSPCLPPHPVGNARAGLYTRGMRLARGGARVAVLFVAASCVAPPGPPPRDAADATARDDSLADDPGDEASDMLDVVRASDEDAWDGATTDASGDGLDAGSADASYDFDASCVQSSECPDGTVCVSYEYLPRLGRHCGVCPSECEAGTTCTLWRFDPAPHCAPCGTAGQRCCASGPPCADGAACVGTVCP